MMPDETLQRGGLQLFTSNRLETLAGKLAEVLHRPLASPFTPEVILVRNKGMERWLRLELARRHGVSANQRFPFPEAFAHELFRTLLPELPPDAPLNREAMTWRILGALDDLVQQPGFEPLQAYLAGPESIHPRSTPDHRQAHDDRKRFQLSSRIANLFDQYLVFRPGMMLEWDNAPEENDWQSLLWRAVSKDLRDTHPAALWKRFHQVAESSGSAAKPTGLPERLCIFGVSALPPFYLSLFAALAPGAEVNLFLLQPSQEYWGDITSAREGERILRQQARQDAAPFELHLTPGNRLLASMGYLGRDFLKIVLEAGDWIPHESFEDPGSDSLLHTLQSDILHLQDRGKDEECPKAPVQPGDASIQIHSCHSPLREMEVLQDQMLDWFQNDPGLTPRDIVVMTPDIESYAPFIQAVFGAPEHPSRAIPFSLADRSAHRQSHVVDTFLQICDLPATRLEVPAVLSLLDTESVRQRFALTETDLAGVRRSIEGTHIRWGQDERQRRELGLPDFRSHTWQAGLDRLLLGYGMAGDGTQLFNDILPFAHVEGEMASILGRFVTFMEAVFATVNELATSRALADWATTFNRIVDRFFQPTDEAERDLLSLRDILHELRREQTLSGFAQFIGRDVVLERLRPALEQDRFSTGFLTGGVTFCGLKPMRSIPFKIVCLVGMNDGAFPRTTQHLGFDRMARAPRLGDRSTREDDRYLFLETLLSARQRFYLSYVGQSIRDNKEAPPSVLVSELLDYIEQGFDAASGALPLREQLVTRHRLQAFHADYFRPGSRLFSYSQANAQASRSSQVRAPDVAPFLVQPLAPPETPSFPSEITIEDLSNFLLNPSRFFLRHRLGVRLTDNEAELETSEPFVLDGLSRFHLKQELLEKVQSGPVGGKERSLKEAAGELPPGTVGEVDFQQVTVEVTDFHAALNQHGLLAHVDPLAVDLRFGDRQLTGRIAARTAAGPVLYRCAKLKARDVLRAWVLHLVANAVVPGQTTVVAAEDQIRRFGPVGNASIELEKLLAQFAEGWTRPLPFFPESSLAYAEARFNHQQRPQGGGKGKSKTSPLEKARERWEGTMRIPAEKDDRHFQLCFRAVDPVNEEFAALSWAILEPLVKSQSTEDL